jgi:hypothetical protein
MEGVYSATGGVLLCGYMLFLLFSPCLLADASRWFDGSCCALLARYFLCARKESNQSFLPQRMRPNEASLLCSDVIVRAPAFKVKSRHILCLICGSTVPVSPLRANSPNDLSARRLMAMDGR